jgi:hypothetical protein
MLYSSQNEKWVEIDLKIDIQKYKKIEILNQFFWHFHSRILKFEVFFKKIKKWNSKSRNSKFEILNKKI